MKKDDVKFRYYQEHGESKPCINVKCYRFPDADDIVQRFGCSKKQGEKAAEWAFNVACTMFWENCKDWEDIFSPQYNNVKIWQAGRSGGWLLVDGLPDIESWDAVLLAKWGKLERYCKESIKDLSSTDCVMETIEANRWNEDGAEEYNFIDRGESSACIVDLKQEAEAAIPEHLRDVVHVEIGKRS